MRADSERQTESGRWVRRGSRIVLLPAEGGTVRAGAPGRETLQRELETGPPAYTVCDFIHPRIDEPAQYALFGMLRRDSAARAAALEMLAAVKAGSLGGIFQVDRLVPAKRALRLGKTWWTLIPPGRGALCVTQPAGEPPLIVFRKSLASDHARLGRELQAAWAACGLPALPPPPPRGTPCTRPAGPSVMVVVPSSLLFDRRSTVAGVIVRRIRISGNGPGPVRWQARPAVPWLTFIPSSGTATAAGAEIEVVVEAGQLKRGTTYLTNVLITSPQAGSVNLDVEVR